MQLLGLLLVLVTLLANTPAEAYLVDGVYVEPIPLSRCERSVPIFNLIPAAMLFNTNAEALNDAQLKRPIRQQQSAVIQQIQVNQNAGQFGGRPGFGRPHQGFGRPSHFGGFGGGISGGFGGGFGRPFHGRSFESEPEINEPMIGSPPAASPCAKAKAAKIAAPPCPKSYLFSCQPKFVPVSCSNGGSSCY